jgi:hypothetical protein
VTTFGTLPSDVVTNSRGDVQAGVALSLYATQADAAVPTGLLATVTTDAEGRWSYMDAARGVVWVRTSVGSVYATVAPDALYVPLSPIGCRLTGCIDSIPNAAMTSLSWPTETMDTHGFHESVTNPSRVTIPAGQAGLYTIGGVWVPTGVVGTSATRVLARVLLNGAEVWGTELPGGVYSSPQLTTELQLAVGDYIQFAVYQNSGAAKTTFTTSTGMYVRKVGI